MGAESDLFAAELVMPYQAQRTKDESAQGSQRWGESYRCSTAGCVFNQAGCPTLMLMHHVRVTPGHETPFPVLVLVREDEDGEAPGWAPGPTVRF